MSRIKSQNTKLEVVVRKILFSKGMRYRLHAKDLPGKPDVIFRPSKVAVFVPSTRQDYWLPKLKKNVQRNEKAIKCLNEMEWKIYIIWECFIKDDSKLNDLIEKIFYSVKDIRAI